MTFYTYLCAGLGNRLFQIASVMGLAADRGTAMEVIGHDMNPAHDNNLYDWLMQRFPGASCTPLDALMRARGLPADARWDQPYTQHLGYYPPEGLHAPNGLDDRVVTGFFQSERYFLGVSDAVRRTFAEPACVTPHLDTFVQELQTSYGLQMGSDVVVIHVRIGDYVGNAKHFVDLGRYYERCIAMAKERFGTRVAFALMCDTPQWIDRVYPTLFDTAAADGHGVFVLDVGANTEVAACREAFDLYFMTRCAGVISSNSTFSWWGGWLNAVPNKFVCVPSRWLQDRDDVVDMADAVMVNVNA